MSLEVYKASAKVRGSCNACDALKPSLSDVIYVVHVGHFETRFCRKHALALCAEVGKATQA